MSKMKVKRTFLPSSVTNIFFLGAVRGSSNGTGWSPDVVVFIIMVSKVSILAAASAP